MAVPECEREEGRFTLPMRAEYLVRYTLEITANEKVFLPEYRKAVTDDIIDSAKSIYLLIREANDTSIRVGTIFHKSDLIERNKIQRKALRTAQRLLYLIDLAHRVFHLSSKRVKYWGGLTLEIRNRIQGWIASDIERYSPK